MIILDCFDEDSKLPAALARAAFAEDLARVAASGVAANLVRTTALDEPDPGCEALAAALARAAEARGGAAFLVGDALSENAVLFAQLTDADADGRTAAARAGRAAARCGVLFDCARQLRGAARVGPGTAVAALRRVS